MKIHNYKLNKIKFKNFSVFGYSFAGEETVIVSPELNCSFDIGRCPAEALAVDYVLLSHGHLDHSAGIAYYFAQKYFQTKKIGTALVPLALTEPLEKLMSCWNEIDGNMPPHKIIGMKVDNEFTLNQHLKIRTFATNHLGPSLGFVIIETRQKLKKEFKNFPKEKLIALKKDNIKISITEEIPLIAYLGDTALGDFINLPYINNAKVLITECTFFTPEQKDKGKEFKHLHVSELNKLLKNSNNEKIIISHVTKSVKFTDAKKLLLQNIDKDLSKKIRFLMD